MNGKGVVSSLDGMKAKVSVTTGSECMACPTHGHCFGGNQGKREITVINDFGANVSDHVVFEADTAKVILSASLIWIIPLMAMIIGYLIAGRFTSGGLPIAAAFLFLAGSFLILKVIDHFVSGDRMFYPKITKIIKNPEDIQDCLYPPE